MALAACNRSLTEYLDFPSESVAGVEELQTALCAADMKVLSDQLMDYLSINAVIDQVQYFNLETNLIQRACSATNRSKVVS